MIFFRILKNYINHLNIIFFLFDKLKITLKEVKTFFEYSLIILLDQQVDGFDMTTLKKRITVIWDLFFSETLKNLEIYLDLTDWLCCDDETDLNTWSHWNRFSFVLSYVISMLVYVLWLTHVTRHHGDAGIFKWWQQELKEQVIFKQFLTINLSILSQASMLYY